MVTAGMLEDETPLSVSADEVRVFMDAFARCDPAGPAPGPQWDARTVAAPSGTMHSWAGDIIAQADDQRDHPWHQR